MKLKKVKQMVLVFLLFLMDLYTKVKFLKIELKVKENTQILRAMFMKVSLKMEP